MGDTDEMPARETHGSKTTPELLDEFDRPASVVLKDTLTGGVNLPWNLALSAAIGVLLMFSRATLGLDGTMAHVHHVVGALAMTVVSVAAAEVARAIRFFNLLLGVVLAASPFVIETNAMAMLASVVLGLLLAALSFPKGKIKATYGNWDVYIK